MRDKDHILICKCPNCQSHSLHIIGNKKVCLLCGWLDKDKSSDKLNDHIG